MGKGRAKRSLPRLRCLHTYVVSSHTLYIEAERENSYVRCCRCLGADEISWQGAHVLQSCWHSEAKRPWRSWGDERKSKERILMVLKFIAGLALNEVDIRLCQDIHSNKQRAAITRQRIMTLLACSEEIPKLSCDWRFFCFLYIFNTFVFFFFNFCKSKYIYIFFLVKTSSLEPLCPC